MLYLHILSRIITKPIVGPPPALTFHYMSSSGIESQNISCIILYVTFITYAYQRILYFKAIKQTPFNFKFVYVIFSNYCLIAISGPVYIMINGSPIILIFSSSIAILDKIKGIVNKMSNDATIKEKYIFDNI
jgi:hypothetical protein